MRKLEGVGALVTGGAGYVGSHVCKALAKAGYTPITYDTLERGDRMAVRWGPLEVGDIADRDALSAVIKKHQPAAIMHFAAYAYVAESVTDPAKYYRNNVAGSLTLLEAAKDHDIDKFIFSSSCAVYGVPEILPIDENSPSHPISPYGRSKLIVEQMLQDFEKVYGLRYVALRYFNAAGADPEAEIGEDHNPETHLIPLVIEAALVRRSYVEIYGTDYQTPDGTAIRDYIHVTDLASAHVRALEYLERGNASVTLNLGTGQGYSVREVVATAEQTSGQRIPVRERERRSGDPPVLIADGKLSGSVLDWRPEHSDLSKIVETAWRWHSARIKGR